MALAAGWSRVLRVLAGLALAAYPLVVWLGLGRRGPRAIAALLLLVMLPVVLSRLAVARRRELGALAAIPLVTAASLGISAVLDESGFMLATPVAINVLLLLAFGASLRPGSTPMITRFAHLQAGELTAPQESWCRAWTIVWCLFFVANGATAALLAWLAPLSWWALYTGALSYGLIAALLVLERLMRARRFPGSTAHGGGAE